jgi:multiple sugar transport system substrate-binding protein
MKAPGSGGMAGMLAAGQPPAYAQTATVHWLRWTDFVPASDQVPRNDVAKQAEKDLGIKLDIETINANDIQGAHHLVHPVGNWARRHLRPQ